MRKCSKSYVQGLLNIIILLNADKDMNRKIFIVGLLIFTTLKK